METTKSQIDASHKTRSGIFTRAESLASVETATGQIRDHWQAYVGTYLDPDEVALVNELKPLMDKADGAVARLVDIPKSGDQPALDDFARPTLNHTRGP